jgi:hypothetical protein
MQTVVPLVKLAADEYAESGGVRLRVITLVDDASYRDDESIK